MPEKAFKAFNLPHQIIQNWFITLEIPEQLPFLRMVIQRALLFKITIRHGLVNQHCQPWFGITLPNHTKFQKWMCRFEIRYAGATIIVKHVSINLPKSLKSLVPTTAKNGQLCWKSTMRDSLNLAKPSEFDIIMLWANYNCNKWIWITWFYPRSWKIPIEQRKTFSCWGLRISNIIGTGKVVAIRNIQMWQIIFVWRITNEKTSTDLVLTERQEIFYITAKDEIWDYDRFPISNA